VFVDPITIQKLTMREAVNNLCKLVETTMVSLGSTKYIKTIKEILNQGKSRNWSQKTERII
jgi:gamma-glutamyl:cysteine ligase YbdK (ATP-grasp superfamily)